MVKILTVIIMLFLIVYFILVILQSIRQIIEIDYWEENSEWWWRSKDDIITIIQYNPESDNIIFETFNYHVRYKMKREIFNKMIKEGEFVQYNHEK